MLSFYSPFLFRATTHNATNSTIANTATITASIGKYWISVPITLNRSAAATAIKKRIGTKIIALEPITVSPLLGLCS